MRNYCQPGHVCTLIAPVGGVQSGDGVLIGSLFGVASYDAAEAAEVEVALTGVFDLPKVTGAGPPGHNHLCRRIEGFDRASLRATRPVQ